MPRVMRRETLCPAQSILRVCLEMVTVLVKRASSGRHSCSQQAEAISYSPWPHHFCCFCLSGRDYLFLSLSQWLSRPGSSCNQCDATQRYWSWGPGRGSHPSPAGQGRKQILLSRVIACKRCWQYTGHFFSQSSIFPVLLTCFPCLWEAESWRRNTSIIQAWRKPRREMRCPELLAGHTSKEMSRVKKSIKEKKQGVMGKGRETRTQKRGQAWRGIIIMYHTFLVNDWQTGLFLHLPYESKSLHTLSLTFPSIGWP